MWQQKTDRRTSHLLRVRIQGFIRRTWYESIFMPGMSQGRTGSGSQMQRNRSVSKKNCSGRIRKAEYQAAVYKNIWEKLSLRLENEKISAGVGNTEELL